MRQLKEVRSYEKIAALRFNKCEIIARIRCYVKYKYTAQKYYL
jgi:hypothetical protein